MIRRQSRIRSAGAFTLVEILISMTISVMVLSTIYLLFFSSTRTLDTTGKQSDLMNDVRLLVDRISRELRQAKRVVMVSPGKITFEMFDPEDLGLFGVVGTTRVSYAIIPSDEKGDQIQREEQGQEVRNLFRNKVRISEEIFQPFVEDRESFLFRPFDWKANFNEDRERISYIRFKFTVSDFRDPKISIDVISGVCLRHIHDLQIQPYWKYPVD
ncbi:MAG: hypothetical protein CVV64_03590 [Candidatus Wallbacteria bacterium HGW-Wallbacteria-1]|jgi:type II secretory pathway pseudopilin PulG|uniref:Prepilin-type N-terminal cleavage/methylation domain-containing protein n=1 Tax=Candidatus Wallbacteria bacterium HGW-Wallbacteria-1 TaxID=2013854 RepID=A0A2N1PTT9_9BACT|nr:MAG: hypothetical protein CVV64_03590 [Candidatus Wallbacteria bacterium HGW-Wallbacteria-1]